MVRRNRTTQVKREREQKKRERQRRKAEKAAQKRERRFGQENEDTESPDDRQDAVSDVSPEDNTTPSKEP